MLANSELACGRQFILPETGMLARPDEFAAAILELRRTAPLFDPRRAVLARWTWPHTIARLQPILESIAADKIQMR